MSTIASQAATIELGILPGDDPRHRVAVVMVGSQLQLRSQSWGDGLGWFTQSTVALEAEQATQLRDLLGISKALAPHVRRQRPAAPATSHLRVHRAG